MHGSGDPGHPAGLFPVPGDGVLARRGNLILLCSLNVSPLADQLLDLLEQTADGGGDGRRFTDAVAEAVEAADAADGPSVLAFGPAAAGLAVTVSGGAWADVTTADGTARVEAGRPEHAAALLAALAGQRRARRPEPERQRGREHGPVLPARGWHDAGRGPQLLPGRRRACGTGTGCSGTSSGGTGGSEPGGSGTGGGGTGRGGTGRGGTGGSRTGGSGSGVGGAGGGGTGSSGSGRSGRTRGGALRQGPRGAVQAGISRAGISRAGNSGAGAGAGAVPHAGAEPELEPTAAWVPDEMPAGAPGRSERQATELWTPPPGPDPQGQPSAVGVPAGGTGDAGDLEREVTAPPEPFAGGTPGQAAPPYSSGQPFEAVLLSGAPGGGVEVEPRQALAKVRERAPGTSSYVSAGR